MFALEFGGVCVTMPRLITVVVGGRSGGETCTEFSGGPAVGAYLEEVGRRVRRDGAFGDVMRETPYFVCVA